MALSKLKINQLKRQINTWNSKHPVDLFWRQHFQIPFGSKEHLDADIFDQQIWYEEHKQIEEYRKQKEEEYAKGLENGEIGEIGENRSRVYTDEKFEALPPDMISGMNQQEIEEAFNNMDIAELNKQYGRELTDKEKSQIKPEEHK